MSKTPTSHEVWSREQRAKQHAERMARKKRSGPVRAEDYHTDTPIKPGDVIVWPDEATAKSKPLVREEVEIELMDPIDAGTDLPEGRAPMVRVLQAKVDAVPAKKRGRPKTSDVDRKTYQRELMRKKRAAAKGGK